MSQTAKTAREAMKAKAQRLAAGDPHTKVDSSTWSPPEPENAGVKTGARPLSKRLYKKGGKVIAKMHGEKGAHRGDRKPRKSGGRAERYLTPDNLLNRDVRMANDVREGTKHVGAFKKGGKAHKLGGGPIGSNPVSEQAQSMGKSAGMMKKGGKVHKGKGGPTGIEEGYRPTKPSPDYRGVQYSDADQEKVSNLAKYGSMKGNPTMSSDYPESQQRKDGGKVKWIQKAIRHKGALHKSLGVPAGEKIPAKKLEKATHAPGKLGKRARLAETLRGMHAKGGKAGHPDEAEDKKLIKNMVKGSALKSHGGGCTCARCSGGRTMKYAGGGVFSGDSKTKIPGVTGGRQARKAGGKSDEDKGGFFSDMFDNSKAIKSLEDKGAVAGITKEDFAKRFGVDPKNIGSRIVYFGDKNTDPRVDYYRTDKNWFGGSSSDADMPAKKAAPAAASAPAYKPASGPMPGSTQFGMRDPQQQMDMEAQARAQRIAEDQASRVRDRQTQDIAGDRAYREAQLRYNPYASVSPEDPLDFRQEVSRYQMAQQEPTFVSYNPYQEMTAPEDRLSTNMQASANRMRGMAPTPVAPEQQGFGALDRSLQDFMEQQQIDASRRRILQQQGNPAFQAQAGFKRGGRTKGKMNVNIVIATGKGQQQPMGMPNAPVPAPKAMPVPPPQGMPMPPAGPQGGMPPMPPQGMPMPRKAGGRTIHVIDNAAGGGLGRLEKVKAYGAKQPKMPARKK